jgi:hypothetical protein
LPSAPSPGALLPGSTTLCPNALNRTPDPAWDIATGKTPWYTDCGPAFVAASVSRKAHGAAGTFDLPLSAVPTNPTIEPRQGPAHAVVFTFNKPITAATAAIPEGVAFAGAPAISGNEVTVLLSGAADRQYVTVSLTNVVSADTATGGGGSVRIGFLAGDVTQNRVVQLSDLGQVNAWLAFPANASNYLKDVNASGAITVADKAVTNANLTRALPAP